MTDAIARAEEVHQRLLGLVHPTSLTLCTAATGARLAFLAPAGPGEPAGVHIHEVSAGGSAEPQVLRLGYEPVLVRWANECGDLWTVHLVDGEPRGVCLRDGGSGTVIAEGRVAGAVEDAWVLGDDSALLLVADPGSDRDGMHLGKRVGEPAGPRIDSPGRRLRRLVHVRAVGDEAVMTPLDLDGWTVWDADVRDGTVAMVASRDPLPAGYYHPSLLTAELDLADEVRLRGLRELHRADGSQLARPRIAPDRSAVLVVEGISIVSGQVLHVPLVSPDRSGPQHLSGLDDVTDLGPLPDGRWWFAGWSGTGVQVGTFDLDGPTGTRVRRWTAGATAYGSGGQAGLVVGADGEHGYTVWEAPGEPPEVVRVGLESGEVTALTGFNAELADLGKDVATIEVSWRSSDGTSVSGVLLTPSERPGTEPLPGVLLLHGGPTWLWTQAFAPAESNLLALALAAAGAAVLLPNPRGSSGRGQEHARAIIGHMGVRDLDDVLTGLDHLVDTGVVDPDRTAVMGLSYGGYLSAVASGRTDRFRAAVVMSGVSDWLGFATTSAIGGGYEHTYLPAGDLHTAAGRETLVAHSPLYDPHPHPTPVLLVHGAADRITPPAQAEQLYRARTAAGAPVELVTYPGEGHELSDPDHQADACRRVVDWLHRHGVLG